MFPAVREAVASLIDPASLRWISWSHFEVDECGALNEMAGHRTQGRAGLRRALGAMINIADFANRPPRALKPDENLSPFSKPPAAIDSLASLPPTPHPSPPTGGTRACCLEESERVLLCSDLLHQIGDVEPTTTGDITGRYRHALKSVSGVTRADGLRSVHGQHQAAARPLPPRLFSPEALYARGPDARIDVPIGDGARRC